MMPENWNGLKTDNDLDYAAQSLGFNLTRMKAMEDEWLLRAKPEYWKVQPTGIYGSKAEVTAYLLGFNDMRDNHWERHRRDTAAILAILKPFG